MSDDVRSKEEEERSEIPYLLTKILGFGVILAFFSRNHIFAEKFLPDFSFQNQSLINGVS